MKFLNTDSFQLPPDLLVLTKIDSSANYKMYGDKIHMNSTGPVYAEYVANVREGDWPVYFAKMIEYALAMDFAPSIRDSAASMDANARQYLNASRMARFTDSQQYPVEPLRSRPFIDVRR